ncbi:unnamed protein product [Trichobilharzia szidati]|nr:unnamed protein product [Trichobilharzia szidati]
MLFEFIALIVLCGSNGVIGDERDQIPLVDPKAPACSIFCEVCTSSLNITKFILDNEPFLPIILGYLTPICYMLPEKHYREKCYELFDRGVIEKIHEWLDQINIYDFCSKIWLCNNTISGSSEEPSCINQHMEYASTYLMNPKYVETASEELCRTYTEDFSECKDTLMMLANNFIKMQRQLLDVF